MVTNEMIGIIVSAVIAVGSFITLMIKAIRPINELNISIVRLTAAINSLLDNDKRQDERIKKHGEEIDRLTLQGVHHEERIKNLEEK